MFTLRRLAVFILFVLVAHPSFADDTGKFLGIWKIASWESEFQATGEREPVMGKSPTGYLIFTPEGRSMLVITGEGRKAPKTDQDRADIFKSLFAYTGMYRVEGDKYITKIDVSWNPAWIGTEQERFFRFDGDRLQVISAWVQSTTRPEKGMARAIISWERVK